RDALREFDVVGDVGAGQQRFRQPLADVLLATARQRSHLVERLPCDDPDEVRPRVVHLRVIDSGPPQPRLLQDVLRVSRGPEHLVGDRDQQAAVGDERIRGHAVDATPEVSRDVQPAESRTQRRSPATRSCAPCWPWWPCWPRLAKATLGLCHSTSTGSGTPPSCLIMLSLRSVVSSAFGTRSAMGVLLRRLPVRHEDTAEPSNVTTLSRALPR